MGGDVGSCDGSSFDSCGKKVRSAFMFEQFLFYYAMFISLLLVAASSHLMQGFAKYIFEGDRSASWWVAGVAFWDYLGSWVCLALKITWLKYGSNRAASELTSCLSFLKTNVGRIKRYEEEEVWAWGQKGRRWRHECSVLLHTPYFALSVSWACCREVGQGGGWGATGTERTIIPPLPDKFLKNKTTEGGEG